MVKSAGSEVYPSNTHISAFLSKYTVIQVKVNNCFLKMDDSFNTDTSFYEDSSMIPGPWPPKRRKLEEKMTPADDRSFNSLIPGSTAKVRSPSRARKARKQEHFSDLPAPATPLAVQGKERMDVLVKEVPNNMKEMMEAKSKEMMESLQALETHQVQGEEKLLASAAAIQKEVSAYMGVLTNLRESYMDRINFVSNCFDPPK